jgi:type IV pilus assembly protein PilC
MRSFKMFLVIFGGFLAVVGLLVLPGVMFVRSGMYPGLILLLFVFLFYGWMLFAYLHYRQGRQEEFLQLIGAAVEAELPLAPALESYLRERPRGVEREAWVMVLLLFVFPGYYWIWHQRHSFDCKVARVVRLLRDGVSLSKALQAEPGVVSRDALLAVAIGQATGKLAPCLRYAARGESTTLWLQAAARLLYPVILVSFLIVVTGVWMENMLPKLQRIFAEFGEPLPETTDQLASTWEAITDEENLRFAAFGCVVLIAVVSILIFSSYVRWYLPGVGRLYRMHVQGRALRMLGLMLDAGKPVPEALDLLSQSGYFAPAARRQLRGVRKRVEQGETLADSLRRRKLLPKAMAPLVQAAERMRNLPWALKELGENRIGRLQRVLQRLSMGLTPVFVIAIGLMVGFIALGMFTPLVTLVTVMGE